MSQVCYNTFGRPDNDLLSPPPPFPLPFPTSPFPPLTRAARAASPFWSVGK